MYMHVNQDQTNLLVKNEITCMYPHIGLIVFVVYFNALLLFFFKTCVILIIFEKAAFSIK